MTTTTSVEGGAGVGSVPPGPSPDTGPAPQSVSPDQRVVDAALRCIARWGLAKTTLDDVAREAGCSRATVYRLFPGGKQALIQVVGGQEIARLLDRVASELAEADDEVDALSRGLVVAARFVDGHEALATLLHHEPQTLLPLLAFDRLAPVLEMASAFLAPALAGHLEPTVAAEAVEWGARIVLSYSFLPGPTVDLTDEAAARRLVTTYLAPGFGRADTTVP